MLNEDRPWFFPKMREKRTSIISFNSILFKKVVLTLFNESLKINTSLTELILFGDEKRYEMKKIERGNG